MQSCVALFHAFIFILTFLRLFLQYFKDEKNISEESVENVYFLISYSFPNQNTFFFFPLGELLRILYLWKCEKKSANCKIWKH